MSFPNDLGSKDYFPDPKVTKSGSNSSISSVGKENDVPSSPLVKMKGAVKAAFANAGNLATKTLEGIKASKSTIDIHGRGEFHRAVMKGDADPDKIKDSLNKVDATTLNTPDKTGDKPVISALRNGQFNTAELLLGHPELELDDQDKKKLNDLGQSVPFTPLIKELIQKK